MLVYNCKHCGKMIIGGYVNEFDEHFCSENCYKIYCAIHGYEVHTEKLHRVRTALD